MTQIEVYAGTLNLKGNIHFPIFLANADEADGSFEILLVRIDGHITIGIVGRNTEARTCNNIFRVFGDEWRTVISCTIGQLNNFRGSKGGEIKSGYTGRIIGVSKKPPAVNFSVGL